MTTEHNLPEMYQHFKGDYYVLIRIAKHHANGNDWAVYRPLGDATALYVRPLKQFSDMKEVEGDGETFMEPRFRLLSEEEQKEVVLSILREQARAAEEAAETDEDKMVAHLAGTLVDKLEGRLSGYE